MMKINVKHEVTSIKIEMNYDEITPYRVLYFSGDMCLCTKVFTTLTDALFEIEDRE